MQHHVRPSLSLPRAKIRSGTVLLAASTLLASCAQFMVPTEVTPLYTAAERDAFYAMVNEGVATSATGLTLFYVASRVVERLPSEQTMREKWVPKGVRAYVEDSYVNSAEEREAWRFRGIAVYDAVFARNNNRRLFQPAANLAYFCTVSGGSFQLQHPDKTPFTNPYSLRPAEGQENKQYWADPYLRAAALFPVVDAQKHGAWGLFACTMPDGAESWWARIMPSENAKPTFGSALSMPVIVIVHETPLKATPKAEYKAVYATLNAVMKQAFDSSGTVRRDLDDVTIEAWPGARRTDRWGCREILGTATYGDRIIANTRKVLC